YERLEPEGSYAVFNADDELVVDRLRVLDGQTTTKYLVPIGLDFTYFDVAGHVQNGGVAFTVVESSIVLRTKDGDQTIVDLHQLPWTFNGNYEPSVWNMLAAVAAIYGYYKGQLPGNFQTVAESVRLDPY